MSDDDNAPIICFQHCEDVNIMCLSLPQDCPICSENVWNTPMRIPPFQIPSPFVHSHQAPFSVVIKPTKGTFLQNYTKGANLHVGLTDSRGVVYDFSCEGVSRSLPGWDQCIAIEIIPPQKPQQEPLWNAKLQEFMAFDEWLPDKYDENKHNCYDFTLAFLKLVDIKTSFSVESRSSFSETVIVPHSKKAAQYITSYRRLLEEQAVIQYPENSTSL